MHDRPVDQRIHDFLEVDTGLTMEEAMAESARCLQCKKPLCVKGCPVNIDIPSFIREVAAGDFKKAAVIIREQNMLPAICGRVCPQEVQCEGECLLGNKEIPIAIGTLERFVSDRERESGTVIPQKKPSTGRRVAVVGAGPARTDGSSRTRTAGPSCNPFRITA